MSLEQKIEILNNEKIPQVYEAGQKSMVDESKVIEKTVSGTDFVNIDDVSEIPHNVKVQLSSDTITDFSNIEVTVCGKNLWDKDNPTLKTSKDGYNFYAIKVGAGNTVTYSYSQGIQSGVDLYVYINTVPWSPDNPELWLYHKTGGGLVHKKGKITAGNTGIIYLAVNIGAVTSGTFMNLLSNYLQIEVGSEATEYESYESKIYTSTPDGVVNISSISPTMNIFTNETDINISAKYHKSYGMQTEYDRFWDSYQSNGSRTSYVYAFGGVGWTAKTFKPKYPIKPVGATYMFAQSYANFDGVELDTSDLTSATYMFQTYYGRYIPTINISKIVESWAIGYMFAHSFIVTIEKLIVSENTAFANTMFTNATRLENITFEGTIAKNGLDLSPCTKLSKESITSVINALSSTTTELKVTLSKTAVNNAFGIKVDDTTTYPEGSEYYTLRHSKDNWTISYI